MMVDKYLTQEYYFPFMPLEPQMVVYYMQTPQLLGCGVICWIFLCSAISIMYRWPVVSYFLRASGTMNISNIDSAFLQLFPKLIYAGSWHIGSNHSLSLPATKAEF
jgi:hypothetical protein